MFHKVPRVPQPYLRTPEDLTLPQGLVETGLGFPYLQNLVPFLKTFLLCRGTLLNASHKYPNVIATSQSKAHAVSLPEPHHFGIGAEIVSVAGKNKKQKTMEDYFCQGERTLANESFNFFHLWSDL